MRSPVVLAARAPQRRRRLTLRAAGAGNRRGGSGVESYFLELSEQETAEVLGVRLGTVKSRTARALARLRTEVGA